MDATIQGIEAKKAEQAQYLKVLKMWAKVEQQGICPSDVDTFGFSWQLMPETERKAQEHKSRMAGLEANYSNPFGWPVINGKCQSKLYNYVKTKDGEIIPLNPMIERPN